MTKTATPFDMIANLLETAADAIEDAINAAPTPKPEQKEASNTTGGTWESGEVELKNPLAEAQRVLNKAEEVAEGLTNEEVKVSALLEVAKVHTEIGKQLLLDFDF
jgi:hypothetical protein